MRLIDARITVDLDSTGQQRTGTYRLVMTRTDPARSPAVEIVRLYHQRWGDRDQLPRDQGDDPSRAVLRARTPDGVAQEVYAVLIVHQALRTAIADTTLSPAASPPTDSASPSP